MSVIPKTQQLQKVLVHFFRINPAFLLGEALIEMTKYHFETSLIEAESASGSNNPASSNSTTGSLSASLQALALNFTSALNVTTSGFNFTSVEPQGVPLPIILPLKLDDTLCQM